MAFLLLGALYIVELKGEWNLNLLWICFNFTRIQMLLLHNETILRQSWYLSKEGIKCTH